MAHVEGPIRDITCPNCPGPDPNPNPNPLPPGFDPGPGFDLDTGSRGPQGFTGDDGLNGNDGETGPQGVAGVTGAGVQGNDGPTGPKGFQGNDGVTGATGAGVQGVAGPTGPKGVQGLDGPTGPTGGAGVQGIAGPTGPVGVQGVDGATGPTGVQGLSGVQGVAGTAGPTGAQGQQGPCCAGPQGADGTQGPAGMDGSTGPEGPTGSQGSDGASTTGATGATGDTTNDFSFNSGFNFSTTFDASGTPVTSTLPDNKIFDCWKIAIENNGIDVHQSSNASVGGWASENRATFEKLTSPGKFMLYQTLDLDTTRAFSNKQVIFTAFLSASPAPVDFTMGFIQWNGTANSVGDVIVSDWSTSPPTLNTNFSYYNSFDFTNTDTGLYTWGINTGTLANDLNNLIIFICSKNQFGVGDHVDIGQIRLAIGTSFESYKPLPPSLDLERIENFVEKSYDLPSYPGATDFNGSYSITQVGTADVHPIRYRSRKVITPTITLYSPNTGAPGFWYDVTGATDVAVSADDVGQTGFNLSVSSGTAGHVLKGHIVVDGLL